MKSVIAAAAMSLVISDFANAEETRGKMMKIEPSAISEADIRSVSPALLALVEKLLLKICGHAMPSRPGIVVW